MSKLPPGVVVWYVNIQRKLINSWITEEQRHDHPLLKSQRIQLCHQVAKKCLPYYIQWPITSSSIDYGHD